MKMLTVILSILAGIMFSGSVQAVYFQRLGDLPGGNFLSSASAASSDGSVVVGLSDSANGREAFRWTQTGGMVGLGDLPGGNFLSGASAASSDGSVVVGSGDSANGREAFRWTQTGGMIGLGDLPGGNFWSAASDVSADGSVVVGFSDSGNGREAFRWTRNGGMVGLGDLPGGRFFSQAMAISADGSVVVGYSGSANSSYEAFRWTQTDGMVGLGDLPGGFYFSIANGVSADGSAVVGDGRSALGAEAFRWTQTDGMIGLGDLPGDIFASVAYGASGDGSVVVGSSKSWPGWDPFTGFEPFIWDSANGMQSLQDLLTNYGIDLTGWSLYGAYFISADGKTIVGSGFNQDWKTEAWIAGLHLTVDDLLVFFDGSIEDGILVGYGPGKSAANRLKAFRNKLEAAAELIDSGNIEEACGQLDSCYNKCDGDSPPPDFVTGEAVEDLYNMIVELLEELGCE